MNPANQTVLPWYKQRWPWILMSLPATSIVLSTSLLYFAVTSNDGLVVDDYYARGRVIDQTIARATYAADLGLVADVTLRAEEVSVSLSANDGVALPDELLVSIIHPTRAGFDQVLRLPQHDGVYAGTIEPLTIGRWRLRIEDGERVWRLHGAATLPDENRVTILPYEPQ